MSINLKPFLPVACFLVWLFFVISCEKPADPPVSPPEEPVETPDTTIVIGFGDTITVPIDTLIASFSFTNNNCTATCEISFTNASYNATSYLWDFGYKVLGAPATSTAPNPQHNFRNSGTYQVVLKAVKGAHSSFDTQQVTINRPVLPYTLGGSGSEYGNAVVQTSDGGYVVAGSKVIENASLDVYLLKTDAARNIVWEKNFGGALQDVGKSMQQTPDGGFIIAGYTTSTGAGMKDIYLVRTDAQGNLIWEQTIGAAGDEEATAVALSNDGGYVVAGFIQDANDGTNNKDVLLAKTDAARNLVWQKRIGSGSSDGAYCIQATSDGGFLLGGYYGIYSSTTAISCLIKTNAEGEILWEKNDVPFLWHAHSIDETSDGGFIVAGVNNVDQENADIMLAKIDANGTLEWRKSGDYNTGALYDEVNRIRQTADGGYILCGAADRSAYELPARKDILVIKTDAAGNMLWTKTFSDGAWFGAGYDVRQTTDGGYILAGMLLVELVEFVSADYDIYLLKLDQNGDVQ